MTALSEYQRLESTGIWRPAPGAQRRDVVVALGDATLVMTDTSNRAVAHWSLAALERRNPGATPALYAPGEDATEDLEISDAEMVAAIEKVRRAVLRARPRPGRLRARLALSALAGILALGIIFVPDALILQALRVAPQATRAELGARLLTEVERVSGTPCTSPAGDQALERLKNRLLGPGPGQILVMRDGIPDAIVLPGRLVLLDRSVVEDHETPEVAAGYVLAEIEAAKANDPLLRLLDRTGPRAAFSLLTTGHVPDAHLRAYAEFLMTARDPAVSMPALLEAFERVGVRASPYAYARDISGEDTVTLIEADQVVSETAMPVLSDGDWVALQGICGN